MSRSEEKDMNEKERAAVTDFMDEYKTALEEIRRTHHRNMMLSSIAILISVANVVIIIISLLK